MFRNVIINSCARALDRIDSWITLSRLGWCDWLAGPMPETAADQAIREQAELLRAVCPQVDFDDLNRHVR